ncbi:MAG: MarR family winged helix-turn-helix transcriptional regulator [Cellvibrionaceae bacterium]
MSKKMGSVIQKKRDSAGFDVDMSVLESKLGYQVRMADRILNRQFSQNVGMTPVQYSVFALVASNEGLSQVAIGESLRMDRASTMAIVDKLQLAGLIERRQSPHDKRMQALYLSSQGQKEFKIVESKVKAHDKTFLDTFSAKDAGLLVSLIGQLRSPQP